MQYRSQSGAGLSKLARRLLLKIARRMGRGRVVRGGGRRAAGFAQAGM
jgi:hypothetical protein